MNNTQLIGLSRQVSLSRELDIVANNVANISTNGFKRRTSNFGEYLMPVARADTLPASQRKLSYVLDRDTPLDMSGGAIERTGNPMDVAIRGDALFAVQTPAGERYTRNGALSLNARGDLVTSDGHPILSEQGPLAFTAADGDIAIAADGTISTAQGVRGKLRLVDAANPRNFGNAGKNLFVAQTTPVPADKTARLESSALERSNVNSVGEISRMIEITRSYTTLAQMIQKTDELRRSTLSRLVDNA